MIMVVARQHHFFSYENLYLHNFSPFSVKIYIQFGGLQGGSVSLPTKSFEFGELNMHNLSPFFGLNIRLLRFIGGLQDTPAHPFQNIEGTCLLLRWSL